MQGIKKTIAKIAVLSLILPLILPGSSTEAAGRLTEFQDILSRIKRSGTGAETAGYAESNAAIRSRFVFIGTNAENQVSGANDEICIDTGYNVAAFPALNHNYLSNATTDTCNWGTHGEVLTRLVRDSAMVSGFSYTGPQVASFIKEAVETALRRDQATSEIPSLDDSYSVTYAESSANSFVFSPGVNDVLWVNPDHAIASGNTRLSLIVDGGLSPNVSHTGAQVAAALKTALEEVDTDTYTVTYNTTTNRFTITANTNGLYLAFADAKSTAALYLGFETSVAINQSDVGGGSNIAISTVPAQFINRFTIRGDGGNQLNPVIKWAYDADESASGVLGFDYATVAAELPKIQPYFYFYPNTNDQIHWTEVAVDTFTASLIDHGDLLPGVAYTGDEVAAAIKTAMEDDLGIVAPAEQPSATVSAEWNDDSSFAFRIQTGSTQEVYIHWGDERSTAVGTLGFTNHMATDVDLDNTWQSGVRREHRGLRSAREISNVQVQFNVIANVNDQFFLNLNGASPNGTELITVAPDNYLGSGLAAAIQTGINDIYNDPPDLVATSSVDYGVTTPDRFTVFSDATGTESIVNIESGPSGRDFLPTVNMVNNIPKDGQGVNVVVGADHTLSFRTENAVPASGQVIITFPSGFVVPDEMGVTDVDFAVGATLEGVVNRPLATVAGTGAGSPVGLDINKITNVFTFTLNNNAGIAAGQYVEIRIGRNAVSGGNGNIQIINPVTPGMYQIQAETREAVNLTFTNNINNHIVWDPDGIGTFVFETNLNEEIRWDPDGPGTAASPITLSLLDDGALNTNAAYTGAQVATALKTALEGSSFRVVEDQNDVIVWNPEAADPLAVADLVEASLVTDGGLVSGNYYTGDEIADAIKAAMEASTTPPESVTITASWDPATRNFSVEADEPSAIAWGNVDSTARTLLGYVQNSSLDGLNVTPSVSDGDIEDRIDVVYNSTTNRFSIQNIGHPAEATILWEHADSTAARLFGFLTDVDNFLTIGLWNADIVAGTYVIDLIADTAIVSGEPTTGEVVAVELEDVLEDTDRFPEVTGQDPTYTVTYDPGTGRFSITGDSVPAGREPVFYWTWNENLETGIFPAGYTMGYLYDSHPDGNDFVYESDTTSVRKLIDIAYTSVYFVADDQITLTAGVDPNLEMQISGGLASAEVEGDRNTLGVDFGSLEPNAYYKLGGAKTQHGSISVRMDCNNAGAIASGNVACIPATGESIVIRGVEYEFRRVAADAATDDRFIYASVTGSTQEERAAKLLTNLYRSINSVDATVRSNPDRTKRDRLWVLSARQGLDETFEINVNGVNGKLIAETFEGVNSYFYRHNEASFNVDPTQYLTSLEGLSDFRGHNILINTNAGDGYTLQLRDEGPDVTSPFRSWSEAADLGFGMFAFSQSTRWGTGGNTAEGDSLIAPQFQGGEPNNSSPQGLSTEYQTIARNDVSTARDNIMLEYVLRIDAEQPAGNYQNTIDFLVSAQY